MSGDHDQIRATHRRGKVSAAHDGDGNAGADNRLGELCAALHGNDFAFEAVLF